MIQKKQRSTAWRAATSFVLLFSLIITPETAQANASANTETNATTQQQSNDKIKLLDSKPEVADIPKHNKPNRIITNINGNPQSEMGFSWYTSDKFEDAKVWISESKNFKDAKTVDAKAEKVNSKYLERDKHGNIIFKDIAKNDEGEPIKNKNGKEKVNGYYTDKHAGGPEWLSGDKHGKTDLISEPEYTYKAQAKDLKLLEIKGIHLASYNTQIHKMHFGMKT